MKHIVITGSSRGIGFGLAGEFLKNGHRVTLNGTRQESINLALDKLSSIYDSQKIQGFAADVKNFDGMVDFCKKTVEGFGPVDIWINNAGISQSRKMLWELDHEEYQLITEINQLGIMHGSKIAINHMLDNKGGFVYNMAGFGSDGRMIPGMGMYGMSKRALDYYTRSLMKEVKGTTVKVGMLSPGMVMTDLIYNSIESGKDADAQKIFNILADLPETVTPWLVQKILGNKKNAEVIAWLTGPKIMWRFIRAPCYKRDFWEK
ncbi:MAG: SDR family oxidoreductase [Bacteroidetes bacterium]|nr:SDR family oxidoreductase [Bacteroidota bacterium]